MKDADFEREGVSFISLKKKENIRPVIFKVGQRVLHVLYGNGIILEIENNYQELYPIAVKFDDEIIRFFALNGSWIIPNTSGQYLQCVD